MKKRSKKFLLHILLSALIVAVVAGYIVFGAISVVSESTEFSVRSGDSISAVATRAANNGVVFSDVLFKFAIRLRGGRVQMGQYEIPRGASLWRIAGMLSHGKVATTKVVIPEGTTISQVKDILRRSSSLVGDVDCDSLHDWGPVCDLGDGDIFPDTYFVARGTARLAVLGMAYRKMQSIKDEWAQTNQNLPTPLRGWDDVIILASIVQRETPRVSEMPIVASVYLNRLQRGMKLQADPTVVYAVTNGYGDMRGRALLREHLKIDSPYNTYKNFGLPPSPISNVGKHAIRAVLNPADTKYLFFVADGTGGHKFSDNYETHLKNHAEWREIKKLKNSENESAGH